jgi:hypothetical protein
VRAFAVPETGAVPVFRFDFYVVKNNDDGGEIWRLPLAQQAYLPLAVRTHAP